MSAPKSDIEIAREATLKPIQEIAQTLGIPDDAVYRYGPTKAKLSPSFVAEARARPRGKLVLVTAISPTPAGEGKTTTTVGLGDALHYLGYKSAICLREPSLGPCFGVKGGAAGGGYAQVVPMDEINLHFTGDFHAITSANNLLATMLDNSIYWGNELDIDPRRVSWKRCIDLNDRALRHIVAGLDTAVREDGFNITVASEIMAIFCLATSIDDLKQRLAKIIVGETRKRKPVTAADLEAVGALTALLKDALSPNLVQTLEGTPAFVHGGPFANIAHGCNSVLATTTAMGLADYTVTEAGFGADLGAEKFLDIKCRYAGIEPSAVVIVATVRALKMHGGVDKKALGTENAEAVKAGAANLRRHVQNLAKFGMPAVVALNHFTADTEAEVNAVKEICAELGVPMHVCRHWAEGGKGAADLAREVVQIAESGKAKYKRLYADDLPLDEKIKTIATEIYGAGEVVLEPTVAKSLAAWQEQGYGSFPICIAKTQYSFSTDPNLRGAPSGHTVLVREVRLAAGAGFIVALCGEIMTMPGLPRRPSAVNVDVDAKGEIIGLS